MRKSAITVGLLGCVLVATAAWAADKKDDGPGMTTSQRVSSFFGLVDVAKPNAPPAPPGMPAMGQPGTVKMPQRFSNGNPTTSPSSGTMKGSTGNGGMSARSGANYAVDPSMPQPPQPVRVPQPQDGVTTATASDAPGGSGTAATTTARPQPTTSSQPRSSIVGASKQTGFKTATAATGAATASPATGTSSRRAPAGNPTALAAEPAVVSTPAATSVIPTPIPMSKPIPVNKPDGPVLSTAPIDSPTLQSPPQLSTPSMASSVPPSLSSIPVNRPEPVATSVAPPTPTMETRPDVIATHTSPELTVETIGPRTIAVGREARYRVLIRNRGATEARDVIVQLEIPPHAEIAELHGTSGGSTSADEVAAGKPLAWQIDVVPAKSQEELTLTLVPRKSEAFELGVRWSSSTPTARATVEVQEPKLALAISGPSEVSFGEQRLYKLTVTNPGNGAAENVVLQLQPLSPGDGETLSHVFGNLRPGESSAIEVELTARQAGTLKIRAAVAAEGNLTAEAAADVIVRRANLDIVAASPRMLFAGVPGTYEVRVRNSGDDTARNVKLTVDLPSVAKLINATPTAVASTSGQPLTWVFDRIAPGSEQVCTIKCAWEGAGRQQLTAIATGDGDLRKSAVATTDVQAVADLALDVIDTPGPVPVGQPITYEIRVKNRGLKSAEGVDVVAYFSEGIEPEKVDGHTAELQPGMVIFRTLPSVGPNQERVLKITARAQAAGNHRLRVEMQSAAPQTQLSHEDATFFYADEPQASTEPAAPVAAPQTPSPFQPQMASPIRPTASTLPVGAPTKIGTPIAPTMLPATTTNGASPINVAAPVVPAVPGSSPSPYRVNNLR